MPITQARMEIIVREALDAHRAYDALASLVRDTLENTELTATAKCALLATALEAVPEPLTLESENENMHIGRTRETNIAKAKRQRERKERAA